jgi:hypothetical protein
VSPEYICVLFNVNMVQPRGGNFGQSCEIGIDFGSKVMIAQCLDSNSNTVANEINMGRLNISCGKLLEKADVAQTSR